MRILRKLLLLVAQMALLALSAGAFEMVPVPGGRFVRGVPGGTGYPNWTEVWLGADNPEAEVIVSPFEIATHEVTLGLYREFTAEYWAQIDIGYGWDDAYVYQAANVEPGTVLDDRWPAFFVNYYDALLFCNWLSERDGLEPAYSIVPVGRATGAAWHHEFTVHWDRTANGYRLPTEAEWEYAARAGGADRRHMPENVEVLNQVAWTSSNSGGGFHPVGQLEPNLWGLYDMLGNASEWVWDFYQPDYYERAPLRDPAGPEVGVWEWYETQPERTRVARGGSFGIDSTVITAATRLPAHPGFRLNRTGIRVARSVFPSAGGRDNASRPRAVETSQAFAVHDVRASRQIELLATIYQRPDPRVRSAFGANLQLAFLLNEGQIVEEILLNHTSN